MRQHWCEHFTCPDSPSPGETTASVGLPLAGHTPGVTEPEPEPTPASLPSPPDVSLRLPVPTSSSAAALKDKVPPDTYPTCLPCSTQGPPPRSAAHRQWKRAGGGGGGAAEVHCRQRKQTGRAKLRSHVVRKDKLLQGSTRPKAGWRRQGRGSD